MTDETNQTNGSVEPENSSGEIPGIPEIETPDAVPAAGDTIDEGLPAVTMDEITGSGMRAAEPVVKEGEGFDFTGVPTEDVPLPAHTNQPATTDMVDLLVTTERVQAIWDRAKAAQVRINQTINKIDLAKELLDNVEYALNEILAGRDHYEEADRLMSEVEYRIELNNRVGQMTKTTGRGLLIYEIACLVLFGVGVVLVNFVFSLDTINLNAKGMSISITQFISALIWGGLGGVVGALYSLWKHVSDDQDFDSQYSFWYITNPILGIALGAFVFIIIQAGFFSLMAGSESGVIQSAAVIYVLAWICGFKQNVVYEIVRRILDVFRVNPDSSESKSPKSKITEGGKTTTSAKG